MGICMKKEKGLRVILTSSLNKKHFCGEVVFQCFGKVFNTFAFDLLEKHGQHVFQHHKNYFLHFYIVGVVKKTRIIFFY